MLSTNNLMEIAEQFKQNQRKITLPEPFLTCLAVMPTIAIREVENLALSMKF